MKNKLLLLLVIFSISCFSASADEFKRVIEKSYDINREAALSLKNKYGEIAVNTWDKNQVKIVVTMIAETRNKDRAEDFFNNVSVDILGTQSRVTAETSFKFRNSRVKSYSINYAVWCPADLSFAITNKYGDVYLPDLGGPIDLNLKYCDFNIGRLLNDKISIDLGYCDGEIRYINNAVADIDYTELEVDELTYVKIESDFSDFSVDKADEIEIKSSYDEVDIKSVNVLVLESSFSEIDILNLNSSLSATLKYGEIAVVQTGDQTKNIDISAKYTDIFCALNKDVTWKFLAKAKYSEVEFSDNTNYINASDDGSFKKIYSGVLWQKGTPDADFTLEAENADIEIKKL